MTTAPAATSTPADTQLAVALPITLALIAGTVDVTTFVLLHGLFSAHVTGNLVALAAGLAQGHPPDTAAALSIVVFIAAAAASQPSAVSFRWLHGSCRVTYGPASSARR